MGAGKSCAGQIPSRLGMSQTALKNGVLIYVALEDKKLAIIGDQGINEKVPADFWDNIKDRMIERFRAGEICEGVCEAVLETGIQLKHYFPYQEDASWMAATMAAFWVSVNCSSGDIRSDLEFYFGGIFCSAVGFKVRFGNKSEHACHDVFGEFPDVGVVAPDHFVEFPREKSASTLTGTAALLPSKAPPTLFPAWECPRRH